MNKGFIQNKTAIIFLAMIWAALFPLAEAQDAVNPCEILNESIDCSGTGLHGAEIDFKTIKLNGKRKNDPMVNVDEALTISTGIRFKKRAKVELTTNFNGGCPPRVETKRLKPEVTVTYSATLNGNTYTGTGESFTISAPPTIGSYPLTVTFTAAATNGCIDNAPLVEPKVFVLDVIDGAYILSLSALTPNKRATVPNGAYFLKGQGEEIDLSVTFSSPLSSLPFNTNDIVWTVTPSSAGDFTGPNGANGQSVTWTQADDFVSNAEDDLILTVTAPNMRPKSMNLTVYSIENVNTRVMLPSDTQTFPISAANVRPRDVKLTKVANRMNNATDVGNTSRIKLRTRTFTAPSHFTDLENEMFIPPEPDQATSSLQIIKKATYSESNGTLLVEIQSGPVLGDVNLTWERNRNFGLFGGRKILHREHVQVTSGIPGDTVTLVLDGTNDEGPLIRLKDDSVTVRAIPSAGSFNAGYPIWAISNSGTTTINPPSDGDVTFPLSMLPPGDFTITAKIGDDPSQKDTFTINVCQVDLDVNADRNEKVDDQDEAFEEMWNASKGAIFAVNYDDDDLNGLVDGMDFDDQGIPTNEDFTINGLDDVHDIAPLVIPEVGSKANIRYFLILNKHDASAIHIFTELSAGAGVLQSGGGNAIGWAAHHSNDSNTFIEIDITDIVKENAKVTLGIEGLFFKGGRVGWPTPTHLFDGEVDITLVARHVTGGSSTDIGMDKVKLGVAPFLFLPNTQNANAVYLDDLYTPEANNIADKFGSLANRPLDTTKSQWFQDHVQIGFTGLPGNTSFVTFRFPYKSKLLSETPGGSPTIHWQDDWPKAALFGPDHGLLRFRNIIRHDYNANVDLLSPGSGDIGGNFEIVPYSDTWKLGRVIHGNNVSSLLKPFFYAQKGGGPKAVQEPIEINTSWLRVGHVDEMVGFAPTSNTGGLRPYKVVRADTQLAETLIKSGTGAISEPDDFAAIFATDTTLHGVATNAITTLSKQYLFDGAPHGFIHFIDPGDISDGETVTINANATPFTFEFEKSGGVASGNLEVDISAASTTEHVRDQFKTVLDQTIMSNNLQLKAFKDGMSERIVVIDTDFGSVTHTLSETVNDMGFKAMGMMGTNTGGVDFTGMDDGCVRIYDMTGAGQVAVIKAAGKGWLFTGHGMEKTFKTTSQLIWDLLGSSESLFKYLVLDSNPIPKKDGWFYEPDTTSKYIVAKECTSWYDSAGVEIPALWSVFELVQDGTFWNFNMKAQAKIDAAVSKIQMEMGTSGGSNYLRSEANISDDSISGDPNDDFISVPTVYFGQFNRPIFEGSNLGTNDIVDHTAEGFNPNLVNFQAANPNLMVFPKPHMAKNPSGDDVFEKACTDIFNSGATRIHFVSDWYLYHVKQGEVHCGTAVKRDCFSYDWWDIP